MAVRKGHPAHSILDPVGADRLRHAVERLRNSGLSSAEAAAELLRANIYDYLDTQLDTPNGSCPRLRIIKR